MEGTSSLFGIVALGFLEYFDAVRQSFVRQCDRARESRLIECNGI